MKRRRILQVLCFITLMILLWATFSLNWIGDNFGGVGFDEIMFHLNMPLKGTGQSLVGSYVHKVLVPAVGIPLELLIGIVLLKNLLSEKIKEKLNFLGHYSVVAGIVLIIIWGGLACLRAQRWFGFGDYVMSMIQRSRFIDEEYFPPKSVKITFPEEKRNLIYVFVESAETSTQDHKNGGLMSVNYIPELTEIAKDNISFSQSDLLEGASVAPLCGWTIAGIVAETAGLPLKMYTTRRVNNTMNEYASFLPGAVTLGDILEKEGYHNYFMAGSDFEFGGRLNYCTQHGDYTIFDYNVALDRGRINPGYRVWWGFEDEKLFEWAMDELTEIAAKSEPFNFSLLTVDTHCQDGYICNLCEDEYGEQYANVWRCASRQIDAFVKWCQEQPWYENTTIIICGDHCSMDKDFYGEHKYTSYQGETERKVYNAFLNSAVKPVREKNRKFTTLDMFPSTLAALGAEIEGERLGLGVNLFSDEQTLAEQYGYEYMFDELNKMSTFYNKELLYPEKE